MLYYVLTASCICKPQSSILLASYPTKEKELGMIIFSFVQKNSTGFKRIPPPSSLTLVLPRLNVCPAVNVIVTFAAASSFKRVHEWICMLSNESNRCHLNTRVPCKIKRGMLETIHRATIYLET